MYTEALCFLLPCFAFALACYRTWRKAAADWPVIGMLPSVLRNLHRIHDFATEIVVDSGGTFLLKGPRLAEMDMLLTSDPANVHYILTKNFGNFGKGSDFREIFDVWGDGIFAVESEMWENQRRMAKLFIGDIIK
ncbi:hypothetical protein M569_01304 [Genlisea aurea]|uniref:Cytochrome P450 n=1 Tax=Genlisea aurea TaxID=192259 RepID=S8ELE0_9LAMI|nr:hypothetical protein M569_01304 [Genlisea aurea]